MGDGSHARLVNDVYPLSTTSVWTAGSAGCCDYDSLGVVRHWDGSSWTTVRRDILPGDSSEYLNGVAATSDSDVWAVGTASHDGRTTYCVVLHWDGSTWKRVHSPLLSVGRKPGLSDVVALSPTDVWIAGWYTPPGAKREHLLMLHWNGSRLEQVQVPQPKGYMVIGTFSAASPSDIWLSETHQTDSWSAEGIGLHWDGHTWQRATPARPPWRQGHFEWVGTGTAALPNGDAWAVMDTLDFGKRDSIEHLADGHWADVRLPGWIARADRFYAVSGSSDRDVWIVGGVLGNETLKPLTLHWDGKAWTHVDAPAFGSTSYLFDISDHGAAGTWAIGSRYQGNVVRPVVLQWDGHRWLTR